jgi:hypothetical protein
MNVTALDCRNDSLVKQLQKSGSGLGQIFNLAVWTGKTMPCIYAQALSRTKKALNARFLDFKYHSISRIKQLLNQSSNNCFTTQAFQLDLHTMLNSSYSSS